MKISIAMCTCDGERFLTAQLDSIARQTRPPDELVICDDASTDSTAAIISRFLSSSPFPTELRRNSTRLGVTRNFQQAIEGCSGDVIALADQDDVWRADKLARIESFLANSPDVACVFTNARLVDEDGNVMSALLWDHIGFTRAERRRTAGGGAFDILAARNVATGATMAFRASMLPRILPVEATHGMLHDHWIALIVAASHTITCIDEPLIDYRVHQRQHIGAGAPAGEVHEWIDQAQKTGREQFRIWAEQAAAVLNRLESLPDVPRHRIESLRARVRHLRARTALPRSRVMRLPVVAKELLSLRYHRFSHHFWSAAKDVFWRLET